MPQSVLVLDAHAMDHIPDEDMPDVDKATHAVSQEAIDAGVWVCGSGLEDQRASIVAADGTVADGPPVTVGGLTVIEVPSREEAHNGLPSGLPRAAATRKSGNLDSTPRSTRCSVRQTTGSRVRRRLITTQSRGALAGGSTAHRHERTLRGT
jgi:hypothetical protein